MRCPKCGRENIDNAMFCGACGAHLQVRKKKSFLGIAAGIVLAIAILIVAGSIIFNKSEKAENIIEQGKKSTGGSKKLSQKEEELKKKPAADEIAEEGFFSYYSDDLKVSVSLLKNREGENILSFQYDSHIQGDLESLSFRWDSDSGQYQQIGEEEKYRIVLEKKDESIIASLMDGKSGQVVFENIPLEKKNYFNRANIIIALESYVDSGASDVLKKDSISFPTNGLENNLYNEMHVISVYEAGREEETPIYEIVVAGPAFEEAGEASVYKEVDFQKIVNGEETFMTVSPIEEFNVNEYFMFE